MLERARVAATLAFCILTGCAAMDEHTFDDVSLPQARANEERADDLIQTARDREECLEAADLLDARLETWTT